MPTKKPSGRKRGAQPGNTNALKSGRRSKRLKKFIVALMVDPEIRSIIIALATVPESDDVRRFNNARFLRNIAKLKQAIRRYAALVDGPSRTRTLKSVGMSAKRRSMGGSSPLPLREGLGVRAASKRRTNTPNTPPLDTTNAHFSQTNQPERGQFRHPPRADTIPS